MIEGSANDILEPELRKAIKLGIKECQTIINSISELQKQIGKPKLNIVSDDELNNDVEEFVREFVSNELREIFNYHFHDKISRDNAIFDLRNRMLEKIKNHDSKYIENALKIFSNISKEIFRSLIFETEKRYFLLKNIVFYFLLN